MRAFVTYYNATFLTAKQLELGEAYQVLGDPSRRKEFDAGRGQYDSGASRDPHDVFGEEFAENAAGPDSDDSLSNADEGLQEDEDSERAPDEKVTKIYTEATPLVNKFLTEADKAARKALQAELRDLNRLIDKENRKADRPDGSLWINVEVLTGFCIEYSKAVQQLQRDPTNVSALASIKRIQQQFNRTMKGYSYPASWQLPPLPDGIRTQGAGGADQTEKVIGYSPNKNPSRIRFIVTKPDDPCGIQIGNEFDVGSDAAQAYMHLPESERKDIRYSERRYNRDQRSNYKQIQGWTNELGKTPLEYRRALPTGYGLVEFKDNTTDILTRTALRNLLGQRVADNEINKFYSNRQMVPPWAYIPSVRQLQGPEWARIEGNPAPPPTSRRQTNIRMAPGSAVGSKSPESQNGFEQMIRVMEANQTQTKQLVETLVQVVAHLSLKAA